MIPLSNPNARLSGGGSVLFERFTTASTVVDKGSATDGFVGFEALTLDRSKDEHRGGVSIPTGRNSR